VLKEFLFLSIDLKEEFSFFYTETKHLEKPYLQEILRQDEEFVSFLESVIKECVDSGAIECPNPTIYANMISFLAAKIALRGWNPFPKHSEEEVIDELVRLIDSGLTRRY
jgi:hypothetical protein